MKKLFIIGLSLLLLVFGFTSSSSSQYPIVKKTRYFAKGIGENSPSIDFTEVYENGKFTKTIINTIDDGETVYDVYMLTRYVYSTTKFPEYTDIYNVNHHFAWRDGSCWSLDTTDFNYNVKFNDGSEALLIRVDFGRCNCLCDDNNHFLMNFITNKKNENGGYIGLFYLGDLTQVE